MKSKSNQEKLKLKGWKDKKENMKCTAGKETLKTLKEKKMLKLIKSK